MSEPTFREKYEWWRKRLAATNPGMASTIRIDEIERLYAAAHPPKVTAEDVAREWLAASSIRSGSNPASWGAWLLHKALIHGAQLEADRRNAAREDDDEEWVAHATLAAYKCLVDRNGDMGWDGPAVNAAIRAAYRARNS